MGSDYLLKPLIFLVQVIFGLYAIIVLARLLLQWVRADFYNPVSQFVVKLTTPLLHPLRQVVPSVKGIDLASLVLAWLVKSIELVLILILLGHAHLTPGAFLWSIPELISLTIHIFLFSILILVIVSWVNPGSYNPAVSLLHAITEPLMRPARQKIPPISGIDLSPMAVIVALYLLEMLLLPPLRWLTGSPF